MSDERLLETFLELVRIDSPTREEGAVASYCVEALRTIGADVRVDETAALTGSDTGNVIADLPGTAGGTLVLAAHMDCVEPCRGVVPVVRDGVVASDGATVLGADDKAGLAVILEALRRAKDRDAPRPALRVVLTVQEEIGLRGAKALDADVIAGASLCLVLDAEGEPGGIIVAAPTHYTFSASFIGRSAHAGVAPERGVNAIALAARAVSSLELGRLDDATTANVGSIGGGSATNVVPASVVLTGECRSLVRARVESLRLAMESTMRETAERGGGRFEIDWTLEYEGFSLAEDDPHVALVVAACEDAGMCPVLRRTGGGSDANVIAALGVPTLAISCGMHNVHSVEESIALADLSALSTLVDSVVARMAREPL